jgi:hypothetical protein
MTAPSAAGLDKLNARIQGLRAKTIENGCTEDARPLPNIPSRASTPPVGHAGREVLPMCPVRIVTYVSDRSILPDIAHGR